MKKLINRPETIVNEMCDGISFTNPDVIFLQKYKIIRKKKLDRNKVSLISGGGSGHEPAHAGYVGTGMLDAAVCGDVFASPSQIQVYQAIRETRSDKGTLLIIKNYSGDVMNFKNGAALAGEDGIKCEYIKVEDDIAVQDSLYTVGRRGVAGTVLVHKIAGAAAESGLDLEGVKNVAQHAADSVKSIGFAYTSCTVPAKGTPTFDIGTEEMEYGVGIHGEPGISRTKIVPADEMAEKMAEDLLKNLKISKEEETVLLINGFGGTPMQELYVFTNSVIKYLNSRGIKVYRCFAGNYMTSIDMQGASVSLMKLDDTLKHYLDMPSDAPGFRVDGPVTPVMYQPERMREKKHTPQEFKVEESAKVVKNNIISLENLQYMVAAMGQCILKNEVAFCELDSYAGDGDFGMSVAKGFLELMNEWEEILAEESRTIGEFLKACAIVIMEYCGGASGPIWGAAFRAAGIEAGDKTQLDLKDFSGMMQAAVTGIQKTGERSFGRGAVVGDKTLIDALVPCADILTQSAEEKMTMKGALEKGAGAAADGAEKTKEIVARMGRAGTVGERSLGYPDAGAHALGVIFKEVTAGLIFE
ncbi:dihydroxyacetone kinase subunit DhaK [Faecalicatena orotica]|uniref:dihydroxyacetone kinase subunit DhaK n=1 Tax=Faecalicatena orotica TaxID=1544 RepID=UPI003217B1C9